MPTEIQANGESGNKTTVTMSENPSKSSRRTSSSSSISSSSLSSDEDSDGKPIKPLKDYMLNKKELAHELFRSVKREKIRMMLPQTLKKVGMDELEEWCASELSGMSKSRIMSILSGTPMLQSSDTSDTDDSGPSLEIISDTEAWVTDSEQQIKQEGKSSSKVVKTKSKSRKKLKPNAESNHKVKPQGNKIESIKVKKEGAKEDKSQEGESLLDLLELEMRARAIRALIRKEEDVMPNLEPDQRMASNVNALKKTLNSIASVSILHENKDVNDKPTNPEVALKTKLVNIDEDEDLLLILKPTPTISLLSSDGESDELNKRTKKVVENEHKTEETENKVLTTDERRVHVKEKSDINPDTLEIVVVTNQPRETNREKSVTLEKAVIITESKKSKKTDDKIKNVSSTVAEELPNERSDKKVRQKIKKKPISSKTDSPHLPSSRDINKSIPKAVEIDVIDAANQNLIRPLSTDNDYEEIIDLDDYPDDMENDIENDNFSRRDKSITTEENTKIAMSCAETWASRYYQTDSVQNVIKESKIQSEIRKRLRERQKLSKLNHLKSNSITPSEKVPEISETKPTGSVEEYLALKATSDAILHDKHDSISSGNADGQPAHVEDNTDNLIKDIEIPMEGNKMALESPP